ncbi:MAG: hypothetical protein R3264_19790 [Anaerolineae bacterium]|nr:hypothetical protein [Anaerolineae bacterium]
MEQLLLRLEAGEPHQQQGQHHLAALQTEFRGGQATGQPYRRCQQRLARAYGQFDSWRTRYQHQRHKLLAHLRQHRLEQAHLQAELSQRQQARDALDTQSLCRERHLEKDQIMLNLQLLLANLHQWCREHYFAPQWQSLELATATELIYRKAGWVQWEADLIQVTLEASRYPQHQRAMEETCRRFNAANLQWRDGRQLRIRLAPP